nr:atp-dependent dna helicase mph1 [Quercus suber]
MPYSDDFFDDGDDTEFLAVATQLEALQYGKEFESSPRPTKRRRVKDGARQLDGSVSDDYEQREPEEDADYYFPGENGEDIGTSWKSKYKIHVPKDGAQFPTAYFTQTQVGLDSSPERFRGPVWKKPRKAACDSQSLPSSRLITDRSVGLQPPKLAAQRPQSNGQRLLNFTRKNQPTHSSVCTGQSTTCVQAEEDNMVRQTADAIHVEDSISNSALGPATQELADLPSDAFASSPLAKTCHPEAITISSQQDHHHSSARGNRGPQTGLTQMTIFGQVATQSVSASQAASTKHAWPLKAKDEPPTHHKLDAAAMATWTFPTNLGTVRDYQYNIVRRSLFHNTLVALPTGLGKTFIAATVMLNYYRWTTNSQILFMAPTKPLIAQQMEACYHIVGIPRCDTVLMTGETSPVIRGDEWQERRVFFMTPQTVINDLKTGISDPKKIVLIVVDEAHKATGGYAYTEVVSFVRRFNSSFRVLALTATPGSNVEAVQAVIDNLDISRVELRTELSLDIRSYTHEKQTEKEIFDWSDEQQLIMEHLTKALKPSLDKLNTQNAYWSRDPMSLTAFGMNQSRRTWAQSDAGRKAPMAVKGMVNAIFTVLSSFGHSISLLKFHGITPFYTNVLEVQRQVESGETKGKTARAIVESEHFVQMSSLIRGWTRNADFIGHPKLQYLREVVLNHFLDAGEGRHGSDVTSSTTRVMVFVSFRDSAEEVCRVLRRNEPMIRPHVFVGQSGKTGSDGMNQKKQNAVVQDFKAGKYNTLVATSIGEEGLDIGAVDLIVCYDASASPIRMLQRIGRTGRKRMGRIVLLLMRGKEDSDYAKAQDNYAYIQKTIADANKYNYHEDRSPRILPKDVIPVEDKRMIEIPVENSQPVDLNEKGRRAKAKGRKRPPKKFNMPDGVQTGFTKASRVGSADDGSGEDQIVATKTKKITRKAAPKKGPVALLEAEVASIPFLQDVLLNNIQEKELQRKYASAASSKSDIIIRAPDLTRFPGMLRNSSTTKYLPHGRAAATIARTMRSIHQIDDSVIHLMKESLVKNDLQEPGAAAVRLASPVAEVDHHDALELPQPPPQRAASKRQRPVAPRKQAASRAASSVPLTSMVRQPRPKQNLQRWASSGSAAMEAAESSPEPTPADMRIGTQGIDLGSRDTSGEDEEEEMDSDLDAFIARSDEIVNVVSSSLPEIRLSTPKARGRGLRAKKPGKACADSDDEEQDLLSDGAHDMQQYNSGESTPEAIAVQAKPVSRKRRVIDDSDSEGD